MFKIIAFLIIKLFTHIWKTLAWAIHFNERGDLATWTSLTPPPFIELHVQTKNVSGNELC